MPKAGLAEQIEEEMEAYLAEKKAAMSEQEIDKMIELLEIQDPMPIFFAQLVTLKVTKD